MYAVKRIHLSKQPFEHEVPFALFMASTAQIVPHCHQLMSMQLFIASFVAFTSVIYKAPNYILRWKVLCFVQIVSIDQVDLYFSTHIKPTLRTINCVNHISFCDHFRLEIHDNYDLLHKKSKPLRQIE